MTLDSKCNAQLEETSASSSAVTNALPVARETGMERWQSGFSHAAIIFASGAALRLIYHMAFTPFWCLDSWGYSVMFYYWTIPAFSMSERPPMYSLFLGLAQWLAGGIPMLTGMSVRSQHSAVYFQNLLALVAALLLYFSLRTLRVRPKIALAAGLCFSLTGAVCLFELMILSQVLSLFLIMLASYFVFRCMLALENGRKATGSAVAGGICFGLAILTRPENLVFFLALILVLAVLAFRCRSLSGMESAARAVGKTTLILIVSAAPLVLCWMSWTLLNIGEFRINTITGATRTESTYNMFGLVDNTDRVAGEILSRSYQLTNSNGRIYRHHVWVALPELLNAYALGQLPVMPPQDDLPKSALVLKARSRVVHALGLKELRIIQPVGLFDYLGHLSGKLAISHPALYLHNVRDTFGDSFEYDFGPPAPNETKDPHAPEGGSVIRDRALYEGIVWLAHIEAPFLLGGYLALLACVLSSPLLLLAGREHLLRDSAVAAVALAAFATILCSCFIAAYYPQHGVPFLGLFMLIVGYAVSNSKRLLGRIRVAGV